MQWVKIDGAQGEGGGQILRSSLSLSALTGRPVSLDNVRAGRSRPGLMRQHLTALNAAVEICGARCQGAEIGSTQVTFEPGALRPGRYQFAVGTAGSACLVLQTVLLPLLLAGEKSELVLEGGTHNPWAPPFDFLQETFLPVLQRMGARVSLRLIRPGFYPAGGGRLEVTIEPTRRLKPLELLERGGDCALSARVLIAHLPQTIAEAQARLLHSALPIAEGRCRIEPLASGACAGNAVLVRAESEHHTELFCGFGRRGVSSKRVVSELAEEVRQYLESQAPVGIHLADQLVVPFALAGSGAFRTTAVSSHTSTNLEVVQRFLNVRATTHRPERGSALVTFASDPPARSDSGPR